jgi:hypothetical protein
MGGEVAQSVRVGVDGHHLDRPALLVEHVHIKPLARQVQSGVQHGVEPPGAGCLDNPTLSPAGLLFTLFHGIRS